MTAAKLSQEVKHLSNKTRAANCARYFKTGPGQYGEGDVFAGLTVPMCREIAKDFLSLPLTEIKKLLDSQIHEERLIALLILVARFKKAAPAEQKQIFNFYLKQTARINNWDLVDLSAHKIVGEYLYLSSQPLTLLDKLVLSKNLWERRIAVLATFAFINHGDGRPALRLAKALLNDTHDLMHKAVGWMLRELGKRVSEKDLLGFLDMYAATMPRTMLRYAIERLPEKQKKYYLLKKSQ